MSRRPRVPHARGEPPHAQADIEPDESIDPLSWQQYEKNRKPRKNERKFSAATISRDVRAMGLTSLHMMGGVKYLNHVAQVNPPAYLSFIGKLIRADDDAEASGLRIVVQQINVVPTPTPGVLASPVAGDVMPLRLVSNGVVIDDDGADV